MEKITITTWYEIETGNEIRSFREKTDSTKESGDKTLKDIFGVHQEKLAKIESKLLDEEVATEALRLSKDETPF